MGSPFDSTQDFTAAWVDLAPAVRGAALRDNLARHAPDAACIRALVDELPVLPLPGGAPGVAWSDLAEVFGLHAPGRSLVERRRPARKKFLGRLVDAMVEAAAIPAAWVAGAAATRAKAPAGALRAAVLGTRGESTLLEDRRC